MNVVLYSRDLEPITVLELPMWLQELIETQGLGKIAVKGKKQAESVEDPPTITVEVQYLTDEKGFSHKFFVTKDEELALGVVPQHLPGQLQMHQYMMRVIEKQKELLNKLR